MQKNDIIELKIEDMGVDGEGIGKYDGMTFFVKDAVLGDEIEARITKMKKNYGYARVEQILSPSKFRVTPQWRFCAGIDRPNHASCRGDERTIPLPEQGTVSDRCG